MSALNASGTFPVVGRAFGSRPEQRGAATVAAFAAAAVWMFLYEATKEAILPDLSPWQSHSITIVVSAATAAVVANFSMRRQSIVLQTLAQEEARSARLELRQAALAESEARYRLLVEASPEAIAVHRRGRLLYVNAAGAALDPVTTALVGALRGRHVRPHELRTNPSDRRRCALRRALSRLPSTATQASWGTLGVSWWQVRAERIRRGHRSAGAL